jgi:hypothetical protein
MAWSCIQSGEGVAYDLPDLHLYRPRDGRTQIAYAENYLQASPVRGRLRAKGSGRDPTGRRKIGILYQVDSRIRILRTRPCHGAAALVTKLGWLEFVAASWLPANLQQPYGMPTTPRCSALACQTLHIHSLLRPHISLRTCTANIFLCRLSLL